MKVIGAHDYLPLPSPKQDFKELRRIMAGFIVAVARPLRRYLRGHDTPRRQAHARAFRRAPGDSPPLPVLGAMRPTAGRQIQPHRKMRRRLWLELLYRRRVIPALLTAGTTSLPSPKSRRAALLEGARPSPDRRQGARRAAPALLVARTPPPHASRELRGMGASQRTAPDRCYDPIKPGFAAKAHGKDKRASTATSERQFASKAHGKRKMWVLLYRDGSTRKYATLGLYSKMSKSQARGEAGRTSKRSERPQRDRA